MPDHAVSTPLPDRYEPTAQDYEAYGIPVWATEFGPLDGRIFLTAGKPDFGNRHPSTVLISTLGPLEAAQCSGILLSSQLVLTAANCVCTQREVLTPEGGKATLSDSSACAKRAYVTTIVYGEAVSESMAPMEIHSYSGVVRSHPDFELLLDDQQSVLTNRADLAIISLNAPVKGRIPAASLANQEARADEMLFMVGYGYGRELGQSYGLRFIRRDKVVRGLISGSGRFLYEQQGTFLYDGFNGGPCFREERGSYGLVGIASMGTDKELSFTSTYAHRDWLKAEIWQASRRVPASNTTP